MSGAGVDALTGAPKQLEPDVEAEPVFDDEISNDHEI